MLAWARRTFAGIATNPVSLVKAGAESTGLPAASFDFVIARLLFQHLADPVSVAREAHRILKPGGSLVVIDVDAGLFGVIEPRIVGLRRVLAAFGEKQAQRGGNRFIGRMLPHLLRDTGFNAVELESVAINSDESGLAECFPLLDPIPLQGLLASGHISEAEFVELRAAHKTFTESDPFALFLLFMARGVKPAPHPAADGGALREAAV